MTSQLSAIPGQLWAPLGMMSAEVSQAVVWSRIHIAKFPASSELASKPGKHSHAPGKPPIGWLWGLELSMQWLWLLLAHMVIASTAMSRTQEKLMQSPYIGAFCVQQHPPGSCPTANGINLV